MLEQAYYFDEDIQQWVLVEYYQLGERDYGLELQFHPKVAPVPPTLPPRARKAGPVTQFEYVIDTTRKVSQPAEWALDITLKGFFALLRKVFYKRK